MAAGTVTYLYPVSGGTVPPTTTQAFNTNMVTGTINMAAADTTSTITHNMNINTADRTALFPLFYLIATTAGTGNPIFSYAITDANTITLTKGTGAGTDGTYNFVVTRPNTITR